MKLLKCSHISNNTIHLRSIIDSSEKKQNIPLITLYLDKIEAIHNENYSAAAILKEKINLMKDGYN